METYEMAIEAARGNAIHRMKILAAKAERKGDLVRASELKSRIEFLKSGK